MKNSINFISVLLFVSFMTTTCKKGENDPVFSLLSRKTRLTGAWRMTKGYSSFTEIEASRSGTSYYLQFDGNSYTGDETPVGSVAYIYKGRYSLNLNIERDGSFTVEENWDGNIMQASGTWNFTSGVGRSKNKDGVIFILSSVTSDRSNSHLFNKFNTEFTYKINELRNTEITLESGTPIYLNSTGDRSSFQNSYTFKQ